MALDFKLSDEFVNSYKDKEVPWGYKDGAGNSLGEITTLRTYSRVKEDGTKEKWHEICRRVIEGMFTIQKRHARQNRIEWKNDKAQRTAKDAYDRMFNMKWLPPGRGIWSMGSPIVMDDNNSAPLQNCFHGDERFITSRGLKSFKETVGQTVTVLTSSKKWVEAPVKSYGSQKLVNLNLAKGSTYKKSIITTAGHRWFVRNKNWNTPYVEMTTENLKPGHYLQALFGQGIKHLTPSSFGVARGFTFGDGRHSQGDRASNSVSLFGRKDSALKPFFEPNIHRINPAATVEGIEYSGIPNYFFEKPSLCETKTYLLGWLAGYFAADGSMSGGNAVLYSTNIDNLMFCREVAYILGIGTNPIRSEYRISNLTGKPSTIYKLSFNARTLTEEFFILNSHREDFINNPPKKSHQLWRVESVELLDREEEVYCLEVPGTGAFTLEDNILTGNCAACSSEESVVEAAVFLFDASMLGVGVGFDSLGANKFPVLEPEGSYSYVIPDSREGWVESLRLLLAAYIDEGKKRNPLPVMDYSEIRPAGAPIKRFGGIASGPGPLKDLHEKVKYLLDSRVGSKITMRDINDIMNMIGVAVIAGNVRRSAELSLVDSDSPDVQEFTDLKDYDKNPDRVGHGFMANNSIRVKVGDDYTPFLEGIKLNGEPGFVWKDISTSYSRLKDAPDFKDVRATLVNPCSEQNLESGETCTLCEVFIGNCTSQDDFIKTLKVAYMYGKTVTLLPTKWEKTNAILLRNRRIGLSVSGVADYVDTHGLPSLRKSLDDGYDYVMKLDKKYSEWLCVRESVKHTTVKPAGSISLVAGSSPGVHWTPGGEYFIRRITFAKTDPIFEALKDAGYKHSDLEWDPKSAVILFPIHSKSRRSAADVPAWEKINLAAEMQHWWSDNAVSCTVDFKPTEAGDIPKLLNMYEGRLKGISFLPAIENGAYKNMPYEQISKDTYEEMKSTIRRADFTHVYSQGIEAVGEAFCTSDKCETEIETNAMTLEVPTINLDEV